MGLAGQMFHFGALHPSKSGLIHNHFRENHIVRVRKNEVSENRCSTMKEESGAGSMCPSGDWRLVIGLIGDWRLV
jgi:hypothetical protein